MAHFHLDNHVFILRIWREPRENQAAWQSWRGKIEHVDTGQERYVADLQEINRFILEFLTKEDLDPS